MRYAICQEAKKCQDETADQPTFCALSNIIALNFILHRRSQSATDCAYDDCEKNRLQAGKHEVLHVK